MEYDHACGFKDFIGMVNLLPRVVVMLFDNDRWVAMKKLIYSGKKDSKMSNIDPKVLSILAERFGHDTLISLATMDGARPSVRIVNSYYEDGSFYTVTYAQSNKMRQIQNNPEVAICGEWFTGHGTGENLGHVHNMKNAEIMAKLRAVFAEWYDNGHIDENDPNTCLLRIHLTDGVLFSNGTKYEINFTDRGQQND